MNVELCIALNQRRSYSRNLTICYQFYWSDDERWMVWIVFCNEPVSQTANDEIKSVNAWKFMKAMGINLYDVYIKIRNFCQCTGGAGKEIIKRKSDSIIAAKTIFMKWKHSPCRLFTSLFFLVSVTIVVGLALLALRFTFYVLLTFTWSMHRNI